MANTTGAATLTCVRCGFDWHPQRANTSAQTCPECPTLRRHHQPRGQGHGVYDMALELVTLRLTFEQLAPLLRMGRLVEARQVCAEALALLDRTEAPARSAADQPPLFSHRPA